MIWTFSCHPQMQTVKSKTKQFLTQFKCNRQKKYINNKKSDAEAFPSLNRAEVSAEDLPKSDDSILQSSGSKANNWNSHKTGSESLQSVTRNRSRSIWKSRRSHYCWKSYSIIYSKLHSTVKQYDKQTNKRSNNRTRKK